MKNQKNNPLQLDFFLGATTSLGYNSYFGTFRAEPMLDLILLKGAFGCGISHLLKHIKLQEVVAVEYLHAPQEPSRLVGVVGHRTGYATLPEQNQDTAPPVTVGYQSSAILDASAPQLIEPIAPGVCEQVIDLHSKINTAHLQEKRAELLALLAQLQCLQTRAARYITSIGGLLFDSRRAATCAMDICKVKEYATRLCARSLPQTGACGSERRRFLTALTPQGVLSYTQTVQALASKIIVFHDEYGAASKVILDTIRVQALARGHQIITCPCALFPDDVIEYIIVPSLGLAFVTSNTWHPMAFEQQQNVHCSRFSDMETLKSCRTRLRFHTKATQDLQSQCCTVLAQIEECNQKVRALYRPAIDVSVGVEQANVVLRGSGGYVAI